MVILLLTSARAKDFPNARQRMFVTTCWVSAAGDCREGKRLSVGGRGTSRTGLLGCGIVSHNKGFVARIFLRARGQAPVSEPQTSAEGSTNWPRCGPA